MDFNILVSSADFIIFSTEVKMQVEGSRLKKEGKGVWQSKNFHGKCLKFSREIEFQKIEPTPRFNTLTLATTIDREAIKRAPSELKKKMLNFFTQLHRFDLFFNSL